VYNDIYGVLAIAALTVVFFVSLFAKKEERANWVYVGCFVVTFVIGTILYSFAILYDIDADTAFSRPLIILKSMSIAGFSFTGNFYEFVSAGVELAKENLVFHVAIVIHFCVSVSLTFLMVVKLLGKNLLNAYYVYRISRRKKYIVAGCGAQANIFLRSLGSKQKQQTIVIIPSGQIDKKRELMNSGYAVVLIREAKETNEKGNFGAFDDALKKAGAMRCKHETKLVSMFEDDETNLVIARLITDYIAGLINCQKVNGHITLTKTQEEKTAKINLDVRVMYSFLERAEHFAFIEKALGKVRFFNLYEIRARKFLWENPITKLIPPHWIDMENARLKTFGENGKCTYKICNIFIGFGSTNKAILKTSIINNQLLNVDYNALVITKDARVHEMRFRNSAIGLFDEVENGEIIKRGAEIRPNPDGSVYLESPLERNNIVFKEADALSVELYDFVIEEIGGSRSPDSRLSVLPCGYVTVIIALGDNRLSIETALELRQKLYEADLLFGEDDGMKYQRVKIFVKVDENTILADEKILNDEANVINCKINIFGENEEILTEEYIIHEELDILAKNIANRYEGNVEISTAANEWNTCTQLQRESCRYAAMGIRVKLNLLGLDLEKNDKPDSNYSGTFRTRYGTNAAFDLRAERKRLERVIKHARDGETNGESIPDEILTLKPNNDVIALAEYDSEDFADTQRNNLAKLEHQRWNAFYLANDWTKLPKEKIGVGRSGRQDGAAKQHACITTFHGLTELREIQKNAEKMDIEKKNKKQYIEAESLLTSDTIRHDFNTMDFLLDLSNENLLKLREAEEDPNKMYSGILADSGFHICKFNGIA